MRQREKRENWRGWAERRARDDDATIRKTTRPIYRSAEFLTHRETLVTVDRILPLGCRSFVNARCNGEPLAVHPVRAWDEGAIYTTRAPTHSAVKTLSTGENRLAQNRLPNSLLPSLCPAVQRCAPAARSHNTLSPPPSLAHLSTLRALCLAQLDLAIPLLPLSLSPRAREILFGALFSTRRSRFSLPRWLTGSARVN